MTSSIHFSRFSFRVDLQEDGIKTSLTEEAGKHLFLARDFEVEAFEVEAGPEKT